MTYIKNKSYFKKGRPYLDGLRVIVITDQGTAAAAIKAGQIHATTAVSGLQVEDMLKLEQDLKGQYSLYWQPVSNVEHFFGNTEREPWSDPRVMKALRRATDLREMRKAFGDGHYGYGVPFPPDSWYGSPTQELLQRPGFRAPKDQDIAEAIAILKEPGVAETDTRSNGLIGPSEQLPTDVSADRPVVTRAPNRRVSEAERRRLTVMFCDLVGSTDLGHHYGEAEYDLRASFGYDRLTPRRRWRQQKYIFGRL